jgi:salicylate synthetase
VWTLAGGVRAAVELDSDELPSDHRRSRRTPAVDRASRRRAGRQDDRLLLTGDRRYGWMDFEFGAYRFGLRDRLATGTPLARIFAPRT